MAQAATKGIRLRHAPLAVGLSVVAALALPSLASGAPGDLDPGFGGAKHGRVVFDMGGVTGMAVQPNGKIVLVGYEQQGSGFNAVVARFRADGTPDIRFGVVRLPPSSSGASTDALAQAVALEPDGKIVVAGQVTDSVGHADIGIWRLRASGAIDPSFDVDGLVQVGDSGTDDHASALAIDSRGRIVVAGTTSGGAGTDLLVMRLTSAGALDFTLDDGSFVFVSGLPGLDYASSVALQPDGKIVAGGYVEGVPGNAVARIAPGSATTHATFDTSFSRDGIAGVPGTMPTNFAMVLLAPHGHILVLDQVPAPGGPSATVVRLTGRGRVDGSFGSSNGTGAHIAGAGSVAKALTLLPDGGVAVAGVNAAAGFVAKFRSTGRPDPHMGAAGVRTFDTRDDLVAVASLTDGRLLVAGNRTDGTNVVYRLRGELRPPFCGGNRATIVGTRASDTLVGTRHADVIAGLGGGDTITGLRKGDVLCGGPGNDHLSGGLGGDHLYGGHGRDALRGGPGHDTLVQ